MVPLAIRLLTPLLAALLLAAPLAAAQAPAPAPANLLAAPQAHHALAAELVAIGDAPFADPLARAVALAAHATRGHADLLGLDLEASRVALATHATPSEAALALVAAHGVEPTPQERAGVLALDALEEPARSALTRLLDAFGAYDAAGRAAFTPEGIAAVQALLAQPPATFEPNLLGRAGIDIAPVLAARVELLHASLDLRNALLVAPPQAKSACGFVQVLPVFVLELEGCDSGYASITALLVDTGGNDHYMNNAGGGFLVPAALVDLGAGADRYTPLGRSGTNGGGALSSGLLLDEGGDDRYWAPSGYGHSNGGGGGGIGALVDGAGSDEYTGGTYGVNGGGWGGTGLLIDAGVGSERYSAVNAGVNGGAGVGVGTLYDGGGNDVYEAGDMEVNGGGTLAYGMLVDRAGNDQYTALGARSVNGGGGVGVGLLADLSGTDVYLDGASGTGTDRTVVPKGAAGAQIDTTLAPPSHAADAPSGAAPVVGPDADGDRLPAYVDVPMSRYTVGGTETLRSDPAATRRVAIDTNDANACAPACGPSIGERPLPAVPSGAPTVGPDADGDLVPAYVLVPQSIVIVGGDGVARVTPATPLRVNVDPNDADPCAPACAGLVPEWTLPPTPSGEPVVGPDGDSDGVPSHVEVPMSAVTVGGAAIVRVDPAPPLRLALDPDDADHCVPGCEPDWGGAFDALEDAAGWRVLDEEGGRFTVRAPGPLGAGAPGGSVALPLETLRYGGASLALGCAPAGHVMLGAVALEGLVATGVDGRTIAEPAGVTAARCAALGLVPSETTVP